MRVVSWNCNGGFRKKAPAVLALEPDLLVIQEITESDAAAVNCRTSHWIGPDRGKGMAVFNFTDRPSTIDAAYAGSLPWFMPVDWNGFAILAAWACVISNSRRYVRLIHEAVDHYQPVLSSPRTIIVGDLNSNAVFDRKHRGRSHSDLVERLGRMNISSAYHIGSGEPHGEESFPTFFMYRHRDKPYHFDYAFASNDMLVNARLTIGEPDEWILMSDHLPLTLDLPD
jgi:hypothetical protein